MAATPTPVRVRIESLGSLFDPLDPAPSTVRLVRSSLVRYIAERTSLHGLLQPVELVLGSRARPHKRAIRDAFERTFAAYLYRATSRRGHYFYVGLRLLAMSILFMLGLTLLRATLQQAWVGGLPRTLDDGLIILGWVIFWRPADYLLFDWIPLYQEARLYRRLIAAPLHVREAR